MSNSFNLNKAKFGYLLYTESTNCYSFDIDHVKRFSTTSRPFVLEVKHSNDRFGGEDGQARNTLNMLRDDAVYIVCRLNKPVDSCKLVDGLITEDFKEPINTKLPYFCVDDCIISKIFTNNQEEEKQLNELYRGETVRFLVALEERKFKESKKS